ncbi:valine--pyruvate transaminase [Sansalvadorimonas sp. 2012CJ34-2]|uniref:Valine--pyruvate transaminase n=1 Tax=Parendozoicomonas callyspongiae TaxID=2942213 RepID=A0ABT0PIK4_9GAMM|nr:valine--pyruvate transaminase [Sansalvadorimonas sp. 2012CJ34-2]MCL6271051.1 valine--pyruvate transaminase [Sansalvadorimonas sp. 2012CJ34-2]
MKLSKFGEKFTSHSGILSLMDDLGNALADNDHMIMMGGGNPAHIPAAEEVFRHRLQSIVDSPANFTRFIGTYDPPAGDQSFCRDLAAFLKRQFGWKLTESNICLTHGSQTAFFMLFNMLGGQTSSGQHRRIQLPLAPEYIGYSDCGITEDFFAAARPDIETIDAHTFKYRVNFDNLAVNDDTAALCVSRPTNPTGNVLTDREIEKLDSLTRQHDIPFIIDGAYGLPFPELIFTEAAPYWDEHIILCLSLSKLGLPALRTGIIIASEEVIQAISSMNAIISLSPNSAGCLLVNKMVADDSIIHLSKTVIRPWYEERLKFATKEFRKQLGDLPWAMHKPEGAMFLWLWFKDLPITSLELYERLKQRGVLVVSGHYFFPGINDDWQHKNECLRVTYTRDQETVGKGIAIIAEEVRKAYSEQ